MILASVAVVRKSVGLLHLLIDSYIYLLDLDNHFETFMILATALVVAMLIATRNLHLCTYKSDTMGARMRIVAVMVALAVALGGCTGVQAGPDRELYARGRGWYARGRGWYARGRGWYAGPDEPTDFGDVNASFFTFTGLQNVKVNPGTVATVTLANLATGFEALEGLDVSNALLTFPSGTVNRPHIHPRGTETLFVLDGTLDVGLLDTKNNLFTTTLEKGAIFVFPQALVHFQINRNKKGKTAVAYASFSSSDAGTITLPPNLFGSTPPIDVDILAESFAVSNEVIEALLAAQVKT